MRMECQERWTSEAFDALATVAYYSLEGVDPSGSEPAE